MLPTVEVLPNLATFDDSELMDELDQRGVDLAYKIDYDALDQLNHIWQLRRMGRSYDTELERYMRHVLGTVI